MKKNILFVAALLIVFCVFPLTSFAGDGAITINGDYSLSGHGHGNGDTITIASGCKVNLIGDPATTYTNFRIVCGAGVQLTLQNVNIDDSTNDSRTPLSFTGSGNTLTLSGTNTLKAGLSCAAILVQGTTGLEIFGSGAVTAIGGYYGAGIGGVYRGSGGVISISGGTVNATGGGAAAGIGSGDTGSSGGIITILGGAVHATGGADGGAGLGGSISGSGGTINIQNGSVEAHGGIYAAGIGGGDYGSSGTVTLSGGTVTATGGEHGAGIGCGDFGTGGIITVNGAAVDATGGLGGAGIGNGSNGSNMTINIMSGNITARGGNSGSGIGGGYYNSGGTINITGGTVHASGGSQGSGIGAGTNSDAGNIDIRDGIITATGGDYGAGIGGGYSGSGGTIAISGGNITATGGSGGAGIGGGYSGSGGGAITISGGSVTATGTLTGAGLGGGYNGSAGTINITDGVVMATRGDDACDIGAGYNGASGTLSISDYAAVFFRTRSMNPVTSLTHAYMSITGATGGSIYGVPCSWTGDFAAYLRLCTLSYNANGAGGTAPGSVTQHIGTRTAVSSAGGLTKTGYTLAFWSTAPNGSGGTYQPGSTFAFNGNAVLYAQWAPNSYVVTFDFQTGTTVGVSATYNSLLAFAAPGPRTGYTFGGWYREPACITAWNFDADRVLGDTALYAKWTLNPNTFVITFNSQGGSGVAGITAALNSKIFAPVPPTKTGYTFAGWYKEASCRHSWSFTRNKVTASITLYAKWKVNKYTVTFNPMGGSKVSSKKTNFYTTIKQPRQPKKTGHSFGGWYKDAGYSSAWNFAADRVTGNTTLYAKWNIMSYTVSFNSKGGSAVAAATAQYNSLITAPAPPAKAGYTFAGWYKDSGCRRAWNFGSDVIKKNTTLYAKWVAG